MATIASSNVRFCFLILTPPLVLWATRPLWTESPSLLAFAMGEPVSERGRLEQEWTRKYQGLSEGELVAQFAELQEVINSTWAADSEAMLEAGMGTFKELPPGSDGYTLPGGPFVRAEITSGPDGRELVQCVQLLRGDQQYEWLFEVLEEAEWLRGQVDSMNTP